MCRVCEYRTFVFVYVSLVCEYSTYVPSGWCRVSLAVSVTLITWPIRNALPTMPLVMGMEKPLMSLLNVQSKCLVASLYAKTDTKSAFSSAHARSMSDCNACSRSSDDSKWGCLYDMDSEPPFNKWLSPPLPRPLPLFPPSIVVIAALLPGPGPCPCSVSLRPSIAPTLLFDGAGGSPADSYDDERIDDGANGRMSGLIRVSWVEKRRK